MTSDVFWKFLTYLPTLIRYFTTYAYLVKSIRWSLTYVPTQKSDVICECSLCIWIYIGSFWQQINPQDHSVVNDRINLESRRTMKRLFLLWKGCVNRHEKLQKSCFNVITKANKQENVKSKKPWSYYALWTEDCWCDVRNWKL